MGSLKKCQRTGRRADVQIALPPDTRRHTQIRRDRGGAGGCGLGMHAHGGEVRQRWWSIQVWCFAPLGPRDFVHKNRRGRKLRRSHCGRPVTQLRVGEQRGRLRSGLQGAQLILFPAAGSSSVAPPRTDLMPARRLSVPQLNTVLTEELWGRLFDNLTASEHLTFSLCRAPSSPKQSPSHEDHSCCVLWRPQR